MFKKNKEAVPYSVGHRCGEEDDYMIDLLKALGEASLLTENLFPLSQFENELLDLITGH